MTETISITVPSWIVVIAFALWATQLWGDVRLAYWRMRAKREEAKQLKRERLSERPTRGGYASGDKRASDLAPPPDGRGIGEGEYLDDATGQGRR